MLKVSKRPNIQLVSVIIPAYNAEKFIKKSLIGVKSVLDQIRYDYEIICVVDGNVDKTYEVAKQVEKKYPQKIKVVGYETNMGKGYAVKFGMARSRGSVVGFIDAGLDINPNGISMLLEHFEWYGADIIVGSKRHPASKLVYPWQRKILSWGYQMGVRLLFGLNIRDTQAGIKFFKREVLERTLPRLLVKAWAFDLEMLAVANYLGYKKIYEAPIELDIEFGGISVVTSNKFLRTILGFVTDTLAIFYRLNILHYYDDSNRKNWITPKYLVMTSRQNFL
jgi:glycosyltransferase involved in cell wall biosynthesis